MDQKDEIKQKLNIVDIIQEYLPLKKAGTSYKGLCPFHSENSPSFHVSEDKQVYHCFGCQEGGDMFSFVQEVEHVDFKEALKILADKAGVELEEMKYDKKHKHKKDLFSVNEVAARFFNKVLVGTEQGNEAKEYLAKRGVNDLMIDAWQLGYAPSSWDTILKALQTKGYTAQDVVDAGLAIRNDKGKVYDRFRGRVTFPIHDITGKIVGFTARILPSKDDGKTGKYINTPETDIYHKSSILFGLYRAKKAIKDAGYVVLVEGNLDVILSHQVGVEQVVAASGTALTEQQITQLQRLTDTVYISFDSDEAGIQAALRGIERLLEAGMHIYTLTLPEKVENQEVKDPADLIAINDTLWKQVLQNARPWMEFFFDHLSKKHDATTGQGKKYIADELRTMLFMIRDSVERDHWTQKGAQRFDIPAELLHVQKKETRMAEKNRDLIEISNFRPRSTQLSEVIISILTSRVELLEGNLGRFKIEYIVDKELQELAKQLILYYNQYDKFDFSHFSETLNEQLKKRLLDLALIYDKEFSLLEKQQLQEELDSILEQLLQSYHRNNIRLLQHKLNEAEKNNDQDAISDIMKEISHHTQLLQS